MPSVKEFREHHFRPLLFVSSIFLSAVMLVAANWQWRRYNEKNVLVETYKANLLETNSPLLSAPELSIDLLSQYWNKRVKLKGKFDFANQFLIGNRRSKHGAGYWLMTPFEVPGVSQKLIISRGFIPFEEREKESWEKYNFSPEEIEISGVITQSVSKRSSFSPGSKTNSDKVFLYPDLVKVQEILPYPIFDYFYVQAILPAVAGDFPMTDIRIDVPPSTHFWYTFEWILLSILVQAVSFLFQLFKPKRRQEALI